MGHIFGVLGIFFIGLYITDPQIPLTALVTGIFLVGFGIWSIRDKIRNPMTVESIAQELETAIEVASYICKKKVVERVALGNKTEYPRAELKQMWKEYFIIALNKRNNGLHDKLPDHLKISIDDYLEVIYNMEFVPSVNQLHKSVINNLNNDDNASD